MLTAGDIFGAKAASDALVVDLRLLLDDVARFNRKYVVMTPAHVIAVALWEAHTHAFDAAAVTPYIHATAATMQCGKTRLLEVAAKIVARPWLTGRMSAAVLPRKLERDRSTLLLD